MAWLGTWADRLTLAIDHTKIDSDQVDFPTLIHLSASSGINSFDASDVFDKLTSDANRKKIAMTTNDGQSQCYTEIELWDDANEQAWLFTKVPALSSAADTILYNYYDSAQADNTTYVGDTGDTPAQSVWDSNFKLVMHMAQDPNGDVADAIKDSTGNANHGTPAGTMTSADLVDGKIGKTIEFDGTDDYINCANTLGALLDTIYTVECVAKTDVIDENNIFLGYRSSTDTNPVLFQLDHNNADVRILVRDDAGNIAIASKASALTITDYFYIVGVRNGSDVDIYVDASVGTADTDTFGIITENQFNIGAINPGDVVQLATVFNGIIDEIRISNIARSTAWIKATHYSNWDELVSFEIEEEIFQNLNTEIAADPTTNFLDLLSNIQASVQIFQDLKSSIEATFTTDFANISTEIYSKARKLLDLLSDVRAGNQIITDLKFSASAKGQTITDLKTFLKAITYNFRNLTTSIEAVRSKWWLKTEIKAGCAARWNFNTEWNPNRFLCTQIAAKKPYEFSFKTQTDEDYAATDPEIEFKISGYSFPLRTLFLDYIPVGGSNEYPLELWWARGLTGKGTLKNAKIKAEYIDTQDSGGYEVVTCDWISCKINGGEYGTVNETPLALGDIPCDSKLDIILKVECRDCSLTRGLAFFKLIITGDWKEAIYGDSIVYRDGSRYHVGEHDDYRSIDFISRLYVVI